MRAPAESRASTPLLGRIVRVFVAPGELATELRREPRVVGALLVGAVLVVLSTALIPTELWVDMIRQQMLESTSRVPEGFDPETLGAVQRTVGMVAGAIFWCLWALLASGVITFIFGFLLADDARYVHYLAVVAHAFLIPGLGALLTVPLKRAAGDVTLSLNLGLFWPMEGGYVAALLGTLEIFFLWGWVVIGVGVSRLDPRRGAGSAVAVVLTLAVGVAALLALVVPR